MNDRNNGNYKKKSNKTKTANPQRRYNNTQKKDRDEKRDIVKDGVTGRNDFSWYNRNPALTVAAASVPYPYRPGMQLPPILTDIDEPNRLQGFDIPGVMALNWIPSVGTSNSPTDPASIAAKEVFAKVRSVFSGSIEADPPDFIIYLLALDSIFSYIGSLKRIYRVLNGYSPMNYQTPDALLNAMGIPKANIPAWRADKTLLWQQINTLIGMTQKFKCPAVFDIFNRHYWMNDNVYTDDASANSQFYVFKQYSVCKYAVTGTPAVGCLQQIPATIGVNPTAAFNFARSLIDALASSDDAYIISGYLTRAYEGFPVFVVDELKADETFSPLYVPEVLSQIENSTTVCGAGATNDVVTKILESALITQNPSTNSIVSNPLGYSSNLVSTMTPLISIRAEVPSVVDTVEATRLSAYMDYSQPAVDTNYHPVDCGTELPLFWRYYSVNSTNTKFIEDMHIISQTFDVNMKYPDTIVSTTDGSWVIDSLLMSSFDWAPRIILEISMSNAQGVQNGVWPMMWWDVHNVTSVSYEQMKEIHRVCLLSEFNSFNA